MGLRGAQEGVPLTRLRYAAGPLATYLPGHTNDEF